jgi:hypothetical protein
LSCPLRALNCLFPGSMTAVGQKRQSAALEATAASAQ